MKKLAAIILVLLSSSAIAQERTFSATLSESDWNYIATVLGKRPYEESQKIIAAIASQVQSQISASTAEQQQAAIALIEKRKRDEEAAAKAAKPDQPSTSEPDK